MKTEPKMESSSFAHENDSEASDPNPPKSTYKVIYGLQIW